jgi:hypothetical protein
VRRLILVKRSTGVYRRFRESVFRSFGYRATKASVKSRHQARSPENAKETVVLGLAPDAWTFTKSEPYSYVISVSTRSKPMNSDGCSGTLVQRLGSENRTPRAIQSLDTEPWAPRRFWRRVAAIN